MNRKIFVFDMDGTILNAQNRLQPATIAAIAKAHAQKHHLIIATGRPYEDAIVDLEPLLPYLDFIICNNGAYFYNLKTKLFTHRAQIPMALVNKLIELGKNYDCLFALHGNKEAKRAKLGAPEIDWTNEGFKHFSKFKNELLQVEQIHEWAQEQAIAQASLTHNKEVIGKIQNIVKTWDDAFDLHVISDAFLDINPRGISKLTALEDVAKKLKLSLEDVIAFGDSNNDLAMLEKAKFGFCMANGSKMAKIKANEVLDSHNSDAIALKMMELIG